MSKDKKSDARKKDAVELDDAELDGVSGGQTVTKAIETGRSGTARLDSDGADDER